MNRNGKLQLNKRSGARSAGVRGQAYYVGTSVPRCLIRARGSVITPVRDVASLHLPPGSCASLVPDLLFSCRSVGIADVY